MWQKIVAFFTMIFTFIAGLFGFSPKPDPTPTPEPSEPPAAAYVAELTAGETAYLLSLVQANGGIAMTAPIYDYTLAQAALPTVDGVPGETYRSWKSATLNPYFSTTAALGLLAAAPQESRNAIEGFIAWYFLAMNTAATDYNGLDGTIYDYRIFINPQNPTQTVQLSQRALHEGDATNSYGYDSTDSYAALFLSVLAAYVRAYGETALLHSHRADIDRVFAAMLATWVERLGLTTAKPDYAMCYLMDNCEVYAGLTDAAYLYDALGNADSAALARTKAAAVQAGIEKHFYNKLTGHYHAAIAPDGRAAMEATDAAMNHFYPEGAAQLFPLIFGVVAPQSERAKAAYADFCSRFVGTGAGKDWAALQLGGFPWAVLARACTQMGDYTTLCTYLNHVKAAYIDNEHAYPYYNAEAGSLLLALAGIEE